MEPGVCSQCLLRFKSAVATRATRCPAPWPLQISDRLLGPRGCSWDGDATVYIADKAAGALYSFPGNMHNLAPAKLTKSARPRRFVKWSVSGVYRTV